MANKRPISITIDDDVYLYYRLFKKDINISGLINKYLRFMMDTNKEDRSSELLRKELDDLQAKRNEADKRAAAIMLELSNREQEQEILNKKELEAAMRMSNTVRNSDILRGLE